MVPFDRAHTSQQDVDHAASDAALDRNDALSDYGISSLIVDLFEQKWLACGSDQNGALVSSQSEKLSEAG